ncbi:MAG: hypothetical protein GXO19_00445 [Epsilonproteobacteria bacterium]|nr:hypothetical protein [Campylobacterota bacterium]NPA56181.1 hypothetical protein [Campylobacterota bacterium]
MGRVIIPLLLLVSLLWSVEQRLSPLPLPKTYFIDLSVSPCDHRCLQDHLARGEIFSFLAKISRNREALASFEKEARAYGALFRAPLFQYRYIRIVLLGERKLFSSIMDRSAHAIGATLIEHDRPFSVETRYIRGSALQEEIDQLQDRDLIILFLPYGSAPLIRELQSSTLLFIPTINRRVLDFETPFYFGGIDYLAQIDRLLSLGGEGPLAIFYMGRSPLSQLLTNYATARRRGALLYNLKNRGKNLKSILSPALNGRDILLNTPIVTTSLILSQLTLYGYRPERKLSTQINFNPKLFDMTQSQDRRELYIANSITSPSPTVGAAVEIYGIDIDYDWLIYGIVAGVEHLLLPEEATTQEEFIDRQLQYDIQILRCGEKGFTPVPEESGPVPGQADLL